MSGPISEERLISPGRAVHLRGRECGMAAASGARAAPLNFYRNLLGMKSLRLMKVAARPLSNTYLH